MKFIASVILVIVFILFLAAIPNTIHDQNGHFIFTPQSGLDSIKVYFNGIISGETFLYHQGADRTPKLLQDIGRYFLSSYFYLIIAGVASLIIGLLIGGWQGRSKKTWLKDVIGFLGMIPDFILVLLLQLIVVTIFQTTGIQIAEIVTSGTGQPAFLLPIISLSIIPTIYLIRTLSERTYEVLTEEYILMAKSKGINKLSIYLNHVFRNVLPFLKADLHKTVTIMLSNLFIVEYLYSTRGLTVLMFTQSSYQYNLTVNVLFAFIMLYLLLYWSLRLVLFGIGEVFSHD